jgi:hypothetical protein
MDASFAHHAHAQWSAAVPIQATPCAFFNDATHSSDSA